MAGVYVNPVVFNMQSPRLRPIPSSANAFYTPAKCPADFYLLMDREHCSPNHVRLAVQYTMHLAPESREILAQGPVALGLMTRCLEHYTSNMISCLSDYARILTVSRMVCIMQRRHTIVRIQLSLVPYVCRALR